MFFKRHSILYIWQILIDKYGKIIYANDKYAEFMGLTKQEMIGMQIEADHTKHAPLRCNRNRRGKI